MSGPAGSAVELWNGLDNALSGVEDAVNSVCRTLAWPLIQIVELVDGEPAVLRAKAAEWDALATQVRDLAQGHRGTRESAQAGWVSPSGVAYGKRLAEVEQQMLDVAEQFAATAEYLRSVADGLQTVHDVLVDLCVEFVNWMLVTLVTAFLMAPVTMGASWAAGVSVTLTRALIVVTRALKALRPLAAHLQKVIRLLQRVMLSLRKLQAHLDKLVAMQDKLLTGRKYVEKRHAAGKADKWFHKIFDPTKGTYKLGKSGTPFDMGVLDRASALRTHGVADGARVIARDWATNLPWNVPNSVVHGVTWGTVAFTSGLSIPGAEQVGDQIDQAVQGGADWIDQNVFGQPPAGQPAGR
ncbi:WXG100 family type VII secretion target [Micromonospora sp. WMMC250]|uniref:WXG100 family type VII secretion target n=1 Tax=Micromonospora sp. WMMC250 TaxID=3014781 RepID=UPI0022B66395|nr:WXG100 family type VII secretion target [Micromonospora sp. WMMC250]MCZ7374147.1 WXG100 family type VII secretion target [Micromonospora sp. WMMC250]